MPPLAPRTSMHCWPACRRRCWPIARWAAWWPELPTQRCTVHKHRNLLAHAPDPLHKEISADYTDLIHAYALRRQVVEEPYGGEGPQKVKFCFRFRGIED
jgi:hypothetical protein